MISNLSVVLYHFLRFIQCFHIAHVGGESTWRSSGTRRAELLLRCCTADRADSAAGSKGLYLSTVPHRRYLHVTVQHRFEALACHTYTQAPPFRTRVM